MTRAVAALGLLADRIAAVETAIQRAADPRHLLAGPAGAVNQPPGDQNRPGFPNHRAKITNIPH